MFARSTLRTILAPTSSPLRSSVLRSAPLASRLNSTSTSSTATASTEGGVEDKVDEVGKKVAELESQVKDLKSQMAYSRADYINLQKRSESEKLSTKEYAIQSFSLDLLSTLDILSLALKHVPQPIPESSPDLKTLFNGVDMTRQELLKTLERHGVKSFDPTGEKFDPNTMEAMFQAPIPGKTPGTVLECQKLGYMLKGRNLRAAQVGVVQEV